MKKRRLGITLLILLTAAAVALAVLGPRLLKSSDSAAVSTTGKRDTFVTARGLVESEHEIKLAFRTSGIISKVLVDKGDKVESGQPLVRLDAGEITAELDRSKAEYRGALAQLEELRAGFRKEDVAAAEGRAGRAEAVYDRALDDYEKHKRLYAKNAVSLDDLNKAEEKMKVALNDRDAAKADAEKFIRGPRKEEIDRAAAAVDRASANVRYQEALLKEYAILSPINGIVVERAAEPGEAIERDTSVLTVIDPLHLRVRAELEESDEGRVRVGQRVEITTDTWKNKVYSGKVSSVLPALKKKSQRLFDPSASFDINTQEIHIALDDQTGLEPGLTVTVRFLQ